MVLSGLGWYDLFLVDLCYDSKTFMKLESHLNKLYFDIKIKGIGRTTTNVWWKIESHEINEFVGYFPLN